MAKMIGLTRTYENREVIINMDNVAYVEENPDGTCTIGFSYGGGFSVKEGFQEIMKDILAKVEIA